MDGLIIFAGVLMSFILRFGVPLAITVLLTWSLHRMDTRWREEAEEEYLREIAEKGKLLMGPCWEATECAPEVYESCQAYQNPDIPCWDFRANGKMEKACTGCKVWKQALTLAEPAHTKEKEYVEIP
jgi:hypothetical protein